MERWLGVFCKPRQEAVAEENLQRQHFRVYLPRIRTRYRRRGQWVSAVEPLFPRYLFIRIDPFRRSTAAVHSTRGVVDLVRFGREPAVIPDGVMDEVLRREGPTSGLHPDSRPSLCAGELVKLVDGPLAGIEGIFSEENGVKRVTVLLELLGKTHKLGISGDWIQRVA